MAEWLSLIAAVLGGVVRVSDSGLGCGPGGSPCLTGFSSTAFRAAILANLTIE